MVCNCNCASRFRNVSSDSEEFACKPEVVVPHSFVVARPGWNATLEVRVVLMIADGYGRKVDEDNR